ncbi:hypothetical protein BG61_10015 [Caballeronia glathei]|uniref:Uncharacterized protein n=1 Tax=Caballeronia glathei TaxID=60547 RepID=A0A069PRD0_9BURK|nr:hypothetical protein BG61_10015 [Caballeronia glathei]
MRLNCVHTSLMQCLLLHRVWPVSGKAARNVQYLVRRAKDVIAHDIPDDLQQCLFEQRNAGTASAIGRLCAGSRTWRCVDMLAMPLPTLQQRQNRTHTL